jgi:pimeloyl-ACP methyl ester carboxylesterase
MLRRALALLVAGLSTSGCVLLDLAKTRESQQAMAQYGYVGGKVAAADGGDEWLVVLIARLPCDDDWSLVRKAVRRGEDPARSADPRLHAAFAHARDDLDLVDHVLLQHPGSWYTRLAPGCYAVGAFEDSDRDTHYKDEPALRVVHPDRLIELGPGQRIDALDLVIPADGRFAIDELDPFARQTRDLTVRSHEDQVFVSLDSVAVSGAVADLADPRFGAKSGKLGYYDVYTFSWKLGPGIYFLEPFDPEKIPVLFVHGAEGYPQQFAKLIEGLDRARFQPWFLFYPSGARLDAIAHFASAKLADLELRLGFERMAVVAHSMGGLVSRAFILEHHDRVDADSIGLFVSISTPWEGVASARAGVERSPVVVDAWRFVAAGSPFLHELFFQDEGQGTQRHLPDAITHHLIFGVNDQTIAVPSAIRWQVVREAGDRWPLAYGHVDILSSPEASLLLNEILARWSE